MPSEREVEMQLRRALETLEADAENLSAEEYARKQLWKSADLLVAALAAPLSGAKWPTILAVQNAVRHCKALYGDDCFEQLDKLKQEADDDVGTV